MDWLGARETDGELEIRPAALRAGVWLGWLSIAAVLSGLALGLSARHRVIVVTLIGLAAAANAGMLAVPSRWWTARGRGELILAIWSAGLLALTAAVVLLAGAHADLDLLLFLIVPFLATVHTGRRRIAWLTATLIIFAAVTASAEQALSGGQIALRGVLLAAAALLAVHLADLTRRAAVARAQLQERAELERVLLAEAHHRVKNSLQTVADLRLLGRPAGAAGHPFDETAERIRAIAAVHRLLAERRGADVPAAALLELVAHGVEPRARVHAVDQPLDAVCAQHLGIVANELIANAAQHASADRHRATARARPPAHGPRPRQRARWRRRGAGTATRAAGCRPEPPRLVRSASPPQRLHRGCRRVRSGRGMRILIAEDDPVIGLALAQRVAALGHEPVGPVADGAQAVATAQAQPPDLYLFDIDSRRWTGSPPPLSSPHGGCDARSWWSPGSRTRS